MILYTLYFVPGGNVFGVSPAYFFSRFTTDFTVHQIAQALPDLRKEGFSGFQLEIYHLHAIKDWEQKASYLSEVATSEGLIPTQFVAHFLLHGFDSASSVTSSFGIEEMKRVVDILQFFPQCRVVTVPLPTFTLEPGMVYERSHYLSLYQALVEKVGRMLELVESADLRMALELVPSSLVGGIDGFFRLCAALQSDTLGYNFDTGHAFSSKELITLIPARFSMVWSNRIDEGHKSKFQGDSPLLDIGGNSRIYGTHLKDNWGKENLALRPGAGGIPWEDLLRNLLRSGYMGFLDLEIVCEAEKVQEEYGRGLRFLQEIVARLLPEMVKVRA